MQQRVIIESPFAGNIHLHRAYARLCLLDSIRRGEAPLASHLLYPQVLDESLSHQRRLGIELGYRWLEKADLVALYKDFGASLGMVNALCEAQARGIPTENRYLLDNSSVPFMSATDKANLLRISRWQSLLGIKPRLPSTREKAKHSTENFPPNTQL